MLFHNFSIKSFLLIAALTLIAASGLSQSQPESATLNKIESLVTTEWLNQHLNDSDLVVLDCTVLMAPDKSGGLKAVSGRDDYETGHIPSAGFADLIGDISDINSPLKFAMPAPEQFCTAMGALGVGDDSRVVLYD